MTASNMFRTAAWLLRAFSPSLPTMTRTPFVASTAATRRFSCSALWPEPITVTKRSLIPSGTSVRRSPGTITPADASRSPSGPIATTKSSSPTGVISVSGDAPPSISAARSAACSKSVWSNERWIWRPTNQFTPKPATASKPIRATAAPAVVRKRTDFVLMRSDLFVIGLFVIGLILMTQPPFSASR